MDVSQVQRVMDYAWLSWMSASTASSEALDNIRRKAIDIISPL